MSGVFVAERLNEENMSDQMCPGGMKLIVKCVLQQPYLALSQTFASNMCRF